MLSEYLPFNDIKLIFGLQKDKAVNLQVSNVELRGKRLHISKFTDCGY
ncbi:MAG: hypothetical protein HeimC3_22410 [Candidatus Heimdallarchaeota archaeon LC_3]|nr:MAG: hypothetical protein HeimC3_22410 [Candidatus Heimdallarchaeota archaeon LC_3]